MRHRRWVKTTEKVRLLQEGRKTKVSERRRREEPVITNYTSRGEGRCDSNRGVGEQILIDFITNFFGRDSPICQTVLVTPGMETRKCGRWRPFSGP